MIVSIVAQKVNKSRRHRYSKKGETLLRIRWYGYESDDDIWEPIRHLSWSMILIYCKRAGIVVPEKFTKTLMPNKQKIVLAVFSDYNGPLSANPAAPLQYHLKRDRTGHRRDSEELEIQTHDITLDYFLSNLSHQ